MEHERQIAADWLISVDFADTFAQGRKTQRRHRSWWSGA
jgi:hypothetical protein